MNYIQRQNYIDKLIAFKDKEIIKVITGIRRSGKSTLLKIFQDYLRTNGITEKQIISLNLEDYDNKSLKDETQLYKFIKSRLNNGCKTYLFIDEIQQCPNFPAIIDSLTLNPDIDIYITGSNAKLLSGEIATLLTGRYVEISILPLSFKEYLSAFPETKYLMPIYNQYSVYGAFPYTLQLLQQPNTITDYLKSLYNTIVVKDITNRHKIQDTLILENIVEFLFDNIGNPVSAKKIADTLTANGRKIDGKTVDKYLSALLESFIIYRAQRYDLKGRQYLKTQEKYYVADPGLRYALLGKSGQDVGHVLENIVYLELIRRGYTVYVGKLNSLEIDFVAMNTEGINYFQVSASVRDTGTLERELSPLQKIKDNYPKFLLTLDEDPDGNYSGIQRLNVLSWLLNK